MITIRCSELDRVLLCPGSLTLCGMVDPRKGDEGTEGTTLHWMAHSRMVEELGATGDPGPACDTSGTDFSKWIPEFYFRTVRDTVPTDWSLQVETALAYEYDTTEPVPYTTITWVDGKPVIDRKTVNSFILSGHIDALAMSADGTEAIIFDLKTGYDPVDSADCNEQVFGYACLLLRAYPDLQKITAYIVQPRNDEDEGFMRISEPMILEGSTLAASLYTMESRITASLKNAMEVNSGPKQCLWCAAAMQCPAAIAERELMKIKLTDENLAAIKAKPDDATLADWVIAGRVLSRPLEDAKDIAKDRIEVAGSITSRDGVVITSKTGPGSYSWPDPLGVITEIRRLLPADKDFARVVKPSVSKLIDVIAEVENIKKTSKVGNSATAIVNGHIKPLGVQGERVTLQFSS